MTKMVIPRRMHGLVAAPPPDDSALTAAAAVPVPIDASGSATAVGIRTFLFQLVIASGAIVAALGLPETSVIGRVVRFLQREEAIPIIAVAATAIASGLQLLRGMRNHRIKQVLSFFVPNRVAISPIAPPAAVEAAVDAARAAISPDSTTVADAPATKGL